MDLIENGAVQMLVENIEKQGINIDILINNAGFGGHGRFWERSTANDRDMVELNVQALTELCHAYLPSMVKRNSGKILNVASTAGFIPGPFMATYYATKAYVLSLSEALAEELHNSNVTVTALCPGPVATEFKKRAGMDKVKINFKKPASQTAAVGYNAMLKGKSTVIDSFSLAFMLRFVIRFLPRKAISFMSRKATEV
jgi:short-subunit dehydrogenase